MPALRHYLRIAQIDCRGSVTFRQFVAKAGELLVIGRDQRSAEDINGFHAGRARVSRAMPNVSFGAKTGASAQSVAAPLCRGVEKL